MTQSCYYCDSLRKATVGQNYCSKHQLKAEDIKSNAFYMSTRQMDSGLHLSRWTIRTVLTGQQYYKSGTHDHLVTPDNYLFIPKGQSYFSTIDAAVNVEAMVIAFQGKFISDTIYQLTHSEQHLTDQPFDSKLEAPDFLESLYPGTPNIKSLFERIKACILDTKFSPLFLEELYFNLLEATLMNHREFIKRIDHLPSKKKGVRDELFRRLTIGRDYIHAHLAENIELEYLSRVCMLSPFHFLRLFKSLYNCTPHQYITNERLKLAKSLLNDSQLSIQEIVETTGFKNHSAFSRMFKSNCGLSPSQFRIENQ